MATIRQGVVFGGDRPAEMFAADQPRGRWRQGLAPAASARTLFGDRDRCNFPFFKVFVADRRKTDRTGAGKSVENLLVKSRLEIAELAENGYHFPQLCPTCFSCTVKVSRSRACSRRFLDLVMQWRTCFVP